MEKCYKCQVMYGLKDASMETHTQVVSTETHTQVVLMKIHTRCIDEYLHTQPVKPRNPYKLSKGD